MSQTGADARGRAAPRWLSAGDAVGSTTSTPPAPTQPPGRFPGPPRQRIKMAILRTRRILGSPREKSVRICDMRARRQDELIERRWILRASGRHFRRGRFSASLTLCSVCAQKCDSNSVPPCAIEVVLAKTSLSRLSRQAVCDAFADAGLLTDGQMKAASVVDSNGRYSLTAVDAALAKFPMVARIEIKNTLARCYLL
jgi:hypothetical protein